MSFKNFLKSLTSTSSHRRRTRRRPSSARLCLEALEDRCVPSFSVIDLGTLGGSDSQANDINASGQVVGRSFLANRDGHAFLWQNGVMTDLGTLGGTFSNALGINDSGQIVGRSSTGEGTDDAFLLTPEDTDGNGAPDRWFRDSNSDGKNDLMLDLGPGTIANDVNNAGQVVGNLRLGAYNQHAFLWQNGVVTDLGTLGGSTSSASAINDAGQVTGISYTSTGGTAAFLWQGGVMYDIGAANASNDINQSGQVAGAGASPYYATLWTPTTPNGTTGSFNSLGVLPPDLGYPQHQYWWDYSIATGVNDVGNVVGSSHAMYSYSDPEGGYSFETSRAFLWANGAMQDLGLHDATAINNAEQIVGSGEFYNPATGLSPTHAFLITPVSIAVPLLSIDDVGITEGNSGTSAAVFTVRLTEASSQTVTVSFATANGSATAGTDYLATSGTLTFAPGQLTRTISVAVVGDRIVEDLFRENFYVALSNPTGAILAKAWGTGSIDDNEPRIDVNSVTLVEGNYTALLTVNLSNAYDLPVSVDYGTSDFSATAGSDYLPASGRLTFAPGETSKQIAVSFLDDRLVELIPEWYGGYEYLVDAPETFNLSLSNASSYAGYISSFATVGIQDNEPRINFNPTPVTVTEGNSGTTSAVVTVSLSSAYDQTVTVDYTTSDDSALAGSDYLAVSGSLTFEPGQMSKTITVTVLGDRLGEFDESFNLNLANASSIAYIKSGRGSVVIADDEPDVFLEPAYYDSVTEGNGGTTPVAYSIRLSAPYDEAVTVSYSTADGSAVAGSDYVATSGSVTFAPGETTPKTFTVQVIGDSVYEYDEDLQVLLISNSSNASLALDYSDLIILNDDPVVPQVWISGVTDYEGNVGTRTFSFIVSLSEASSQPVTVNYATASGTAAVGSDYQSVSGTVTFAPGETYKTISVLVNGDRLPEANETFFVNLTSPTNAIIAGGQGLGTIVDDEPLISISDVTKKEGKRRQTTLFTFTVTLSAAYDQAVTMSFRTVDGTATTSDSDYIAKTGTLTFNPGETTKTITIEVKGDSKKEADETFYLDLFGLSSNSLFTKNRGIGTILNDD
jgi:probable HAF family extracellular repeat protein